MRWVQPAGLSGHAPTTRSPRARPLRWCWLLLLSGLVTLGHYVLNPVYKHVLSLNVLFIAGFWLTNRFFGGLHRRWDAGLRAIADLAGLTLFSAVLSVFMFLATPVRNTIIRTAEQEADGFGLNAARQPGGFCDDRTQTRRIPQA